MEDPDPEILWHRFGAGDGAAFTALYADQQHAVLRFCQGLLRDPDDAREAANSTWAALWRTRDAAQRDIPLRPWLFRIAHNQAIDILRRRRSHEVLDAALPAPDDTAADAELHERLATLRADLLALSQHQRSALVLRELSGLSHREIGAALEISTGAAKQTIYEARQALLEAEGGRSLSCDLVRRHVSRGDRRVLRGRQIRAHLRGCPGCRAFAAGLQRRPGDLRGLVPWPAVLALLARGGGAGGELAGGGPASGLPALSAKAAAAALAVAVGTWATGGGHLTHAGAARPAAGPAVAAPATGSAASAPARGERAPALRTVAGWAGTGAAPAAARVGGGRRAGAPAPGGHGAGPAGRARPATVAVTTPAATRTPAAANDGALAPTAAPGQANADNAAWAATPPGQAKTPPGQAKADNSASATTPLGQAATPPGQAKADNSPSATTPPGQAATPPGQAKADNSPSATTPPGQAATPPGQATLDDSAPAVAGDPPSVSARGGRGGGR